MTYYISWETRDGDQYEDECASLAEAAETAQRVGVDAMVTIRPPGWFDPDAEDVEEDWLGPDEEPAWPRPSDSH